jgi:SAM-dependent methyltransferase
MSERPEYLEPYAAAARRYGAGFESLLWASPRTQAARFDAIVRLADLRRKRVLDVGCGRGDLLDFLLGREIRPAEYVGLEGVEALAEAARKKERPGVQIVRGDFVAEPQRLFVGAQWIVFSGSLNTMEADAFYATLRRAYEAASMGVVFNFLASPALAGASYLRWHRVSEVEGFAGTVAGAVRRVDDYLDGDCTVGMYRQGTCPTEVGKPR